MPELKNLPGLITIDLETLSYSELAGLVLTKIQKTQHVHESLTPQKLERILQQSPAAKTSHLEDKNILLSDELYNLALDKATKRFAD